MSNETLGSFDPNNFETRGERSAMRALLAGGLALGVTQLFRMQSPSDLLVTVEVATMGAAYERLVQLRENAYYWACDKLNATPRPEDLE